MISASRYRKRGRSAGIARQGQQPASSPERSDVKSWKVGVRTVIAVAGEVSVNQPGIPVREILVRQLEPLAYRMWKVDDQHVSPLDQPFENLLRTRRLQVDGHSALVTVR